jgi:hypothetical protein
MSGSARSHRTYTDPASFWMRRCYPFHERLGQIYAKGDVAEAIEHDEAFIDLWKGADTELQPRVAEARQRVARLSAMEKGRDRAQVRQW